MAGDAALFVQPTNVNEIEHAIMRLIEEKDYAENLVVKGDVQLKKFNWERTANEIMKVILSV